MRCFRLGSPANIAMGDSERGGRWYGDVGSGNSQIDWSVSGPSQAEAVNESGHDSRDILNDPSLYARCHFFGLCLGEHLRVERSCCARELLRARRRLVGLVMMHCVVSRKSSCKSTRRAGVRRMMGTDVSRPCATGCQWYRIRR